MSILTFSLLVAAGSFIAGLLGAMTGLGGGVVIVPLLTAVLHVDLRYAIGASLVSVIATSSGAAAAYVKEGYSNIRLGMFLEIATTIGALSGALIAVYIPASSIGVIFGFVLLASVFLSSRHRTGAAAKLQPDRFATKLRLDGDYPTPGGRQSYHVQRVPLGFGMMWIAGVLSGVLGIGSGAFKVLAMDLAMRVPFKVSTTTSNFMIGVTAAASAGIYLNRGYIDPGLSLPVMLGVLAGSLVGTRVLVAVQSKILRIVFGAVIFALGIEMLYMGFTGALK
jgi:hypothetical protein